MRTIYFRPLAIASLLFLALGGTATAQDKATGLLNTLDVQRLVTSGAPADHARLSTHFAALADRYTAEAKQHESMSRGFVGNPSRNLGTGMSAHCTRLAKLNTESATTVLELAAHHQKLAAGLPSTTPRDGARCQGGIGAADPTKKELDRLAASAKTAADHRALQEYFLTLAKRYTADAKDQVALAQSYRGTKIAHVAVNFDRLAGLSRESAKEATDAAAMHKDLAAAGVGD